MWLLVGFLPYLFFGCELFYQGWSDEDAWKYQRPPPLHYPDAEDTPDAEDFLAFQTKEFNEWYNAGIVKKPYLIILLIGSSRLKKERKSTSNMLELTNPDPTPTPPLESDPIDAGIYSS